MGKIIFKKCIKIYQLWIILSIHKQEIERKKKKVFFIFKKNLCQHIQIYFYLPLPVSKIFWKALVSCHRAVVSKLVLNGKKYISVGQWFLNCDPQCQLYRSANNMCLENLYYLSSDKTANSYFKLLIHPWKFSLNSSHSWNFGLAWVPSICCLKMLLPFATTCFFSTCQYDD